MIVDTPEAFTQAASEANFAVAARATMRAAFLVTPTGFRIEQESARDNLYMQVGGAIDSDRAMRQHNCLCDAILRLGVPTITVPGLDNLPDGVFPNNVFATVPGRFIVGSMRHKVRQAEAQRSDVRNLFTKSLAYELHDLSRQPCTAELTGPLVIDRLRGIAFCGLSERADAAGCSAMHTAFGLNLTFQFALSPLEYHTNVVMAVLAGRGLVMHYDSLADPLAADAIANFYSPHVLLLDDAEKANFAGNCIAITEQDVLMSSRAVDSLCPGSRAAIESWGFALHGVDVSEFEKAGGSLRCMIAEIF